MKRIDEIDNEINVLIKLLQNCTNENDKTRILTNLEIINTEKARIEEVTSYRGIS